MTTERSTHAAWAESQVQKLLELGLSPIDAQRNVDWVLANLPPGEDPAVYIFPADVLYQDPASQVDDSRANWYVSEHIQAKWKRLLDAKEEQ